MRRALIAITLALAFPATAHAARPWLSYPRALASSQAHSHYFRVAGCRRTSRTRFLCRTPLAASGGGEELVGDCWDAVKLRGGTVHDRVLRCRGHWNLTPGTEAGTVSEPTTEGANDA